MSPLFEEDNSFDGISEFPDVAFPVVGEEAFLGFRVNPGCRAGKSAAKLLEELFFCLHIELLSQLH